MPLETPGLLLGDRAGDTTVVPEVAAEMAALSTYLWLISGRRLRMLAAIRQTQGLRCDLHPIECAALHVSEQPDRFSEEATSNLPLIVTVGDLSQRQQHFSLIHR
ncbi:hypothetical protein [Amycolatopsis sp. NBRC 101858]|uniref:hypothetical protein n=1 Tax=Amycolatopsis sp. NBRC 101858 TaxID=3032200 RepID=UPI0025569F19|nr:hypothetical protein [Amycolatopsis sp. NBRC 101858]